MTKFLRTLRPGRRAAGLAVSASLALTGVVTPLLPTTPASASVRVNGVLISNFAARLAYDINHVRVAHGLRALHVEPGTTRVALGWSAKLAAAQRLSHNPALALQLERNGSPRWMFYAENVGYGPARNADILFRAYMNSPHHRANILSRQSRYLGVGVVNRSYNGVVYAWNTLDFVDSYTG